MSSSKTAPEKNVTDVKKQEPKKFPWPMVISWGATGLLVTFLFLVLFQIVPFPNDTEELTATVTPLPVVLPTIEKTETTADVMVDRSKEMDTVIPDDVRSTAVKYTIQSGDSIFSIAKAFGLNPQSVLWANDDYFGGDPTVTLTPGDQLTIPPTDGILYKWKDGDSLAKVADEYDASELKILSWPSNNLDVTNPVVTAGSLIMIPDGSTEIKSWIQEVAYTPRSGVTQKIQGAGGCDVTSGSGYGAVGSGTFIWPSANHYLSGWDFSSFHKGIDIAALTGDPIWATDNGTVVYAGWNDSGYGYMVMIDHNNGYQSLYAHLSAILVSCGQNVYQGTGIGLAGDSGHAEGAHLHFEIRDNGSFVNPWYVLQ